MNSICPKCGGGKYVYAKTCRSCVEFVSGKNHPMWGGGRTTTDQGYVYILNPSHPRAAKNGYVYEHILVAESALGRSLPATAEVHHHNEVRSNNTPSNLVICENKGYHALLHARKRAYEATGNASARRCSFCQSYEVDENVEMAKNSGSFYHRACRAKYVKEARHAKQRELQA